MIWFNFFDYYCDILDFKFYILHLLWFIHVRFSGIWTNQGVPPPAPARGEWQD